ncbi:hypothetical protein JOE11_003646 [Robbsia andropogonis]
MNAGIILKIAVGSYGIEIVEGWQLIESVAANGLLRRRDGQVLKYQNYLIGYPALNEYSPINSRAMR